MLNNITLGQYFPGSTPIHRLDPRTKLLATLVFIVVLFMAKHPVAYLAAFLWVIIITKISKLSFRMILKSLKPVMFIILLTAILNLLYTSGQIVWEWKFIHITKEGISSAVFMVLRIILLISGTSLLTYTTSPIQLTDAIEQLLGPLKKLKVPVHELSMMMTIALRFIPTLIEETEKIMSAQKARGADFESGNIVRRAKALIPILIPLFVSSFRRADELAVAMECRLYHGGEGRTKMKALKYTRLDAMAWFWIILFSLCVILPGRVIFL